MSFIYRASPAASLILVSCSVYAPMQGAAPFIRERNQAELTATTYFNSRWEASAAYSPLRYVLLRGAVGRGYSPGRNDTSLFTSRQYEAALGGYWPISRRYVAGGLLGYGQARTARGYRDMHLLAPVGLNKFAAHYARSFGEVYAYADDRWARGGAAYRFVDVRFRSLTNNGLAVPLDRMQRHELYLFAAVRPPADAGWAHGLGLQFTWGASAVLNARRFNPTANSDVGYVGQLNNPLALTVQLFPDCWFKAP